MVYRGNDTSAVELGERESSFWQDFSGSRPCFLPKALRNRQWCLLRQGKSRKNLPRFFVEVMHEPKTQHDTTFYDFVADIQSRKATHAPKTNSAMADILAWPIRQRRMDVAQRHAGLWFCSGFNAKCRHPKHLDWSILSFCLQSLSLCQKRWPGSCLFVYRWAQSKSFIAVWWMPFSTMGQMCQSVIKLWVYSIKRKIKDQTSSPNVEAPEMSSN